MRMPHRARRRLTNSNSKRVFLHKFHSMPVWCICRSDRLEKHFIGSSDHPMDRFRDAIKMKSRYFRVLFYVLVIVCLMRTFIICWADEDRWWAIGRCVKVGGGEPTPTMVGFLAFGTSEWVIQVVTSGKNSNSSTEVNNLPHILKIHGPFGRLPCGLRNIDKCWWNYWPRASFTKKTHSVIFPMRKWLMIASWESESR